MTNDILLSVVGIIFIAGGTYYLMKWRLTRIEKAVDDMVTACLQYRSSCNAGLAAKLDGMTDEFRTAFKDSETDRKGLRETVNEMNVMLARLDQKVLNGKH